MLDAGARVKRNDIFDQRANPLGSRAGIHGHGAANGAGNTDRKLKARKAARQRVVD